VNMSKDKLVDAEKKGAKFLIGGPSYSGIASLVPTIVTGVTPEMEIYHEESFGPSVALFIARDDGHAIEIANDTPYGLNAAVHSKNMQRALGIARELECAQVHVNNMTAHDERKCFFLSPIPVRNVTDL
jgi:acyl-CoA reductase-like NAD-dependent aldehyde dehydrogenase